MTHIHVKPSTLKIDPKRPESNPEHARALQAARIRGPQLKFENEAQKRDYMKAVASNPNNIPGMPTFYPPEQIKMYIPAFDQLEIQRELFINNLRQEMITDGELFCRVCDRITPFSFPKGYSFCKKCGTTSKYARRVVN